MLIVVKYANMGAECWLKQLVKGIEVGGAYATPGGVGFGSKSMFRINCAGCKEGYADVLSKEYNFTHNESGTDKYDIVVNSVIGIYNCAKSEQKQFGLIQ